MEISLNFPRNGVFAGEQAAGAVVFEKVLEQKYPDRVTKYRNKLLVTNFL